MDTRQNIQQVKRAFTVNSLLWIIYILLLLVLLPHTAWAFSHFEVVGTIWLAWSLAFVFEIGVFGFTHKLTHRIEQSHRLRQKEGEPKMTFGWRRFTTGYLNIFFVGLLAAFGVSTLANFAHSVEFARPMKVYGEYSLPPLLFQIAFGAILPVMSLLFARVLANTVDTEGDRDESVAAAKRDTAAAKREAADLRRQLDELQQQFAQFEHLYAEDKARRILAAYNLWSDLPRASIAVIAGTSPSYVSDVLNANGHGQ